MDLKDRSRSVVLRTFGGYENISVEEFILPLLEDNIEVDVEYGGVNFADIYTRQGLRGAKCPFVMGIECVGKISAIGIKLSSNTNFKVGQRVICYDTEIGLHRDKIRVDAKNCFLLPDYINSTVGCALFVNYLTAWFSLIELGNLRKHEKILIQSCTGGVGIAATQIARTVVGVEVFGVASGFKKDSAISFGVDKFFSNENFNNEIKDEKFDLIIANESGIMFDSLQEHLKPLGRIVIIGANNIIKNDKLDLNELTATKPISAESLIMHNRVVAGLHLGVLLTLDKEKVENALAIIFKMVKNEQLRPVIDSIWPMENVIDAHKKLSTRSNIGKVLISMK